MSFSTVLQGDFGDEMMNSASKPGNHALGCPMVLPDGREFRLCRAGFVGLTGGLFMSAISSALVARNEATNAVAITAGDRTITFTGSFSSTASAYADGYIMFTQGTGVGEMYSIKSSTVSSGSTGTVTLMNPAGVNSDISINGTDLRIYPSPYGGLKVNPIDAQAMPVCVTPRAVTSYYYFWGQTKGLCSLMIDVPSTGGLEIDEKIITACRRGALAGYGAIQGSPAATGNTKDHMPILARLVDEADMTTARCALVYLTL